MTTAVDRAPSRGTSSLDRRTARTAGALYLLIGVAGILAFLVLRPMLISDDPATAAAELRENELLARWRISAELVLVLAQVLVALAFFRLFRAVDDLAAAAIAVFGSLNAVALMVSAASLTTSLEVALDGGSATTVQAFEMLSAHSWGVGNLFFGLWLVPMGWCVLRSGAMPRALGWLLAGGGFGYVASAFVVILAPDATLVAEALVIPASIGEFWMIAYLLLVTGRARA